MTSQENKVTETPPPDPKLPTAHQRIWTFLKAVSDNRMEDAVAELAPADDGGEAWNVSRLNELFDGFFEEFRHLRLDPEARNKKHLRTDGDHHEQSLLNDESEPVAMVRFRFQRKENSLHLEDLTLF